MGLKLERTIAPPSAGLPLPAPSLAIQQLVTQSPEQSRQTALSVPYLTLHGAVFVRQGDRRFLSAADLKAKNARIATGSGGVNYAVERGFSPEQLVIAPPEDCMRQLIAGQIDAVMLSRLTGLSTLHRHNLSGVEARGGIADDFVLRFCFGVRREDARLLDQLNEGLAIVFQTGEYERIYHKWFRQFEPVPFSREEAIAYVAGALALALAVALWALRRQRQLQRRLARQTAELAGSRVFLAEAQKLARVGHWQGSLLAPSQSKWSDEMLRIFERDPKTGPPATLDELLNCVVPGDRNRWRAAIERLSSHGEEYNLDLDLEPAPGPRKTIHVRGRKVHLADGTPPEIFGTAQDVTVSRAAELALRQSEEVLRVLYENLPHALGVAERIGNDWTIISLNPEASKLLGPGAAGSFPRRLAEIGLSVEAEREWRARFDRCLTTTDAFKIETRSTEEKRDYVATLVPLGFPAQRPRCCFLVEDVTARKQKDAEIAQGRRLRALGELVGGIAHEFNNLLTPILLKADQLQNQWSRHPQLHDELKLITDTARRSAELTRRLLTFGRKTEREPELFELRAAIANNVELLRHTIDRRILIECAIPVNLPKLYLCSSDVHHILLNLLLNARDTLVEKLARPPRPDWTAGIKLEAVAHSAGSVEPFPCDERPTPASWITVTIRDNGMGMTPGVLERIFEPFYTTKEAGHGTGLGLATVWHLVNELGGRIDVDSTPGVGTSFRVNLPVFSGIETRGRITPPVLPPALSRTAPLRLLVAEDEEAISRLVSNILRAEGHTVTLVRHGQEAWDILARAPAAFDGLVMDLNMPGLTGLELARRARSIQFERPILIMSGRVTDDDRAELARLRIPAVVHKPFTYEIFLAAFKAYVSAPQFARRSGGA